MVSACFHTKTPQKLSIGCRGIGTVSLLISQNRPKQEKVSEFNLNVIVKQITPNAFKDLTLNPHYSNWNSLNS